MSAKIQELWHLPVQRGHRASRLRPLPAMASECTMQAPWPLPMPAHAGARARQQTRAMKFVMLARNPSLYSHRRIVEAARARSHEIDVINTLHLHMNITSSKPTLMHGGRALPHYDAVIPRIGASITHYGLAVLRQFEMQGVFPLNESVAIGRSRDKLRALQLLARDGIGLPVTAFAHGPRRAEDVIKEVGGAPCVIKLLEGTQGMGVILAETAASAKSIIEAFSAANINILVQEFIKEAGGTDIRALVVGGAVVASMKRVRQDRRFPLQPASRRQGRAGRHHRGGAQDGDPLGRGARPQCRRRRHAALQPRAGGDGGQLLARHRGHGDGDRRGRGRRHDRVSGDPRQAGRNQTRGEG